MQAQTHMVAGTGMILLVCDRRERFTTEFTKITERSRESRRAVEWRLRIYRRSVFDPLPVRAGRFDPFFATLDALRIPRLALAAE